MNVQDAYDQVLAGLDAWGYLPELVKLESAIGSSLWLVGGWVRAALLGDGSYVGDVDTISTLSSIELESRLSRLGWRAVRNLAGGVRVALADGNHVDFWPLGGTGTDSSIADALEQFSVSANGVALRLKDGAAQSARYALEDLASRTVRVQSIPSNAAAERAMLIGVDALIRFEGMKPHTDAMTHTSMARISSMRSTVALEGTDEALRAAGHEVRDVLPKGAAAWMVRGFVRCATWREQEYWDDLDVVVRTVDSDIWKAVELSGVPVTPNYFGYPKVRLASGRTADLWPMQGDSLAQEIARYEFGVDRMAWSIPDECVEDPLGHSAEANLRLLRYFGSNCKSDNSLAYLALKATYLTLRHSLVPEGKEALSIMSRRLPRNGHLAKNARRLTRELFCSHAFRAEAAMRTINEHVHDCAALELIRAVTPATVKRSCAWGR